MIDETEYPKLVGSLKFNCTDGNCDEVIEASTAEEAAQNYVSDGDWGEYASTFWVTIHVTPLDGEGNLIEDKEESIMITMDPGEPDCVNWAVHDYIMAGGPWGNGGGVWYAEVCAYCGLHKETDTWAQNKETGEMGLDSIEYKVDWNEYSLDDWKKKNWLLYAMIDDENIIDDLVWLPENNVAKKWASESTSYGQLVIVGYSKLDSELYDAIDDFELVA